MEENELQSDENSHVIENPMAFRLDCEVAGSLEHKGLQQETQQCRSSIVSNGKSYLVGKSYLIHN